MTAAAPNAAIDLDLGALAGPNLRIKDTAGRIWEITDSPPLLTLLKLYNLAQGGARNPEAPITQEEIDQIVAGVASIFRMTDAAISDEQVAAAFTLDGLLTVIAFLFSGDEARAAFRSSVSPATPAAGATPTTTPTRRRSKQPSAPAS